MKEIIRLPNALSPEERAQLAADEHIIGQGKDAWRMVGLALLDVSECRLWREDYKSFEDYCLRRWDLGSRQRGHQLKERAQVARALELSKKFDGADLGGLVESHMAALTSFPPHLRADIYRIAQETAPGGKLTQGWIEQTGRKSMGDYAAGPEPDLWGCEPDKDDEDDREPVEVLDADGRALTDAADRATPVPLHSVLKAQDHLRKLRKDLQHATDLDIAEALRLVGLLEGELARLGEGLPRA